MTTEVTYEQRLVLNLDNLDVINLSPESTSSDRHHVDNLMRIWDGWQPYLISANLCFSCGIRYLYREVESRWKYVDFLCCSHSDEEHGCSTREVLVVLVMLAAPHCVDCNGH